MVRSAARDRDPVDVRVTLRALTAMNRLAALRAPLLLRRRVIVLGSTALRAIVADDFNAAWVPFQEKFNEAVSDDAPPFYWADDGVHPTMAGHALMAT